MTVTLDLSPTLKSPRLPEISAALVDRLRDETEPDIVFFGHEKSAAFIPDTMKFSVPDFVVEVLSLTTENMIAA